MEYPKIWLENLLRPFEADDATDVVSGFFVPKSYTLFEKCNHIAKCALMCCSKDLTDRAPLRVPEYLRYARYHPQ